MLDAARTTRTGDAGVEAVEGGEPALPYLIVPDVAAERTCIGAGFLAMPAPSLDGC
jgi:hypothetical protein